MSDSTPEPQLSPGSTTGVEGPGGTPRRSAEGILSALTPITDEHAIVLDPGLAARAAEAAGEADLAARNRSVSDDDKQAARQRADQLAAELQQATVVLSLRGLPAGRYDAIRADCKTAPSEEQRRQLGQWAALVDNIDPEKYRPRLVAAVVVDPDFTDEQASQLVEGLPVTERDRLVQACEDVCQPKIDIERVRSSAKP